MALYPHCHRLVTFLSPMARNRPRGFARLSDNLGGAGLAEGAE